MDSAQLLRICTRDRDIRKLLLGVFASNKLPKKTCRPCCLIVNTKPDTHPGEHWVAMFINKEGYGDYFCSYGLPPKAEFTAFMNKHCVDWNSSTKQLQQYVSATCGQYAVFFLHARANGLPMAKFLSLFTKNNDENDQIVTAFINGLYNEQTQVFDFSLINQQ